MASRISKRVWTFRHLQTTPHMVRDVLPFPVKVTKHAVSQEELNASFLADIPAEEPA